MFCINCGASFTEGKFCLHCGHKHGSNLSQVPVAASSSSQGLIDQLDQVWNDSDAVEKIGLTSNSFHGWQVSDWQVLANYLANKTSFAYSAWDWREFNARLAAANHGEPQIFEAIGEAVWKYFQAEHGKTLSAESIACIGFLGNLPAETNFNGDHFDETKIENLQQELISLAEMFAPKKVSPVSIKQGIKEYSSGLPLLSDQGLSLLIPYSTEAVLPPELLAKIKPKAGELNFTMSSLLCVLNEEIETPGWEDLLFSPRIVHFLLDSDNTVESWWQEMYLWQDCADSWKDSNLALELTGKHYSILERLLENSLDSKRYPDKKTAKTFLQDSELFQGLLDFLKD